MTAIEENLGVSVECTDVLLKAIEDAHARAEAVYASGSRSLVSRISDEAWAGWHEVDEACLISDPCGLESDPFDDDETRLSAALEAEPN